MPSEAEVLAMIAEGRPAERAAVADENDGASCPTS